MTEIFVYGTLLPGDWNHHLLEGAECLGGACTPPAYTLVDFGRYPALVAGGSAAVVGEVYRVDAHTLELLDALEEHPDFYVRTPIELGDGRTVETYLLPPELAQGRPTIPGGDWLRRGG
jgi:gamma-glutamylcyclotransferase (GGCT)/AIG2-like uncharacterized protein YtfP